jgi:response regulator RpfG family c-di-GMP phosphodiesterase
MENVTQLFTTNNSRPLSIQEAEQLLPIFLKITNQTRQSINVLNSQVDHYKGKPVKSAELQTQLNLMLQKWCDKMKRLGGHPQAMFKVKILTTEGIRFWCYPEMKLREELINENETTH